MAGGAAALYAATVVSVYRWYVWRQKSAAGGFAALERLDWEALVSELLTPVSGPELTDVPSRLPTGEPTPRLLRLPLAPGQERRRLLVLAVLGGATLRDDDSRLAEAGIGGAQAEWLVTLSLVRAHPELALKRLEARGPASAAEVHLREYLWLSLRANAVTREVAVFASKRRIGIALRRFGNAPCLFFVRARASALVGLNRAAIDDLARAVYFSRQAPFYVGAVVDTPYIEQARPALAYQCRHALQPRNHP